MLDTTKRTIATLTAAACLGGGSWAIASSSNGSSGTSDTSAATAPDATVANAAAYGMAPGDRPQQTEVTGTAAEKIRAAVLAKEPGATILRIEQDAQGYHAHITKADGTPATVRLNAQFAVTAAEAGRGPGGAAAPGMGRGGPGGDCPDGPGGGGGAGGGAEAPDRYGGSAAPGTPTPAPATGTNLTAELERTQSQL